MAFVHVEIIDLLIMKRKVLIYANIAELSLLIPGFEDTEWDTLNLPVQSLMCGS